MAHWQMIRSAVASPCDPLEPRDGWDEGTLAEAERRLGARLPRVLREYYAIAGKADDVNRAHTSLRDPDDLEIEGDVLVFYDENQGVCRWGVRAGSLKEEDPPVVSAAHLASQDVIWEPDHAHLSEFFLTMLYCQAVNGGLPYIAIESIDEEITERIERHWPEIVLGEPSSDISADRCLDKRQPSQHG